jgi:hypothetical protein
MAKRIQGSDDGDAAALDDLPDDADRALSIVRNKLDTRLSVEYRVNELIQEATNPNNLATIFSGASSASQTSSRAADASNDRLAALPLSLSPLFATRNFASHYTFPCRYRFASLASMHTSVFVTFVCEA